MAQSPKVPRFGEEALDTRTGRAVWWDGQGWAYTRPSGRKGSEALPALTRETRPPRLPLSHAQQRLWFIDRLEGTSTEYNMPEALRLEGPLDHGALERAINTIVARHESLRTHFEEVNGDPSQVIVPELHVPVPVENLRTLDTTAQQAAVQGAMTREWSEPFDLRQGPVLRVRVLQLGANAHVLLRTMHHIVSDGWSHGVFNRE